MIDVNLTFVVNQPYAPVQSGYRLYYFESNEYKESLNQIVDRLRESMEGPLLVEKNG